MILTLKSTPTVGSYINYFLLSIEIPHLLDLEKKFHHKKYVIMTTKNADITRFFSHQINLPFQQLNLQPQSNEIDNHNYTNYPLINMKLKKQSKIKN